MPKKDEKIDVQAIKLKQNLTTTFVDNLNIGLREDDVVLLRFLAHLPEGLTEEARFMVNKERLKVMINLLCSQIDYYPVKKMPRKKTSHKKVAP